VSERRLKAAANQAVSYRNYRRARDRALARLANAYPEDYKELLEQEKASDEQQGKKWIDLDGTTNSSTASVSAREFLADHSPDNNRTYKSNNGGEA